MPKDLMNAIAEHFTELRAEIRSMPRAVTHGVGGSIESAARALWMTGQDVPGYSGSDDEMREPFSQHATVYKAVTQIARNLSGVGLEYFRPEANRKTDTPLPDDDPVVKQMRRPDGDATMRVFLYRHALRMELTGNWFVLLDEMARLGPGQPYFPRRLRTLMTSAVRPKRDTRTGDLEFWRVNLGGRQVPVPPEEIMRHQYPGPNDDLIGIAPLLAAWIEADCDYQALLTNRYLFENDMVPGLHFERDKDAKGDTDKDKAFLSSIRSQLGGPRGARKMFIPPPGVKPVDLASSNRDMQYMDLRHFSREQILSIFDVPPAVAGVFEYANYANSKQQLRYFWYHKLFPMMDNLEEVFNTQLFERLNVPVRCYFKREMVQALIEDMSEKLDAAKRAMEMGATFDQVNERFELGFDTSENPAANVSFLPFGMVPAEQLLAQAEEAENPEPDDEDEEVPPKDRRRVFHARATSVRDDRATRWRGLMKRTDKIERQMLGDWRGFHRWLRDEVLVRLRQEHAMHVPAAADRVVRDDESARKVPGAEELRKQAAARMRRATEAGIREARESVAAELDVALDFDLLDPRVLTLLNERVAAIKIAAGSAGEAYRRALAPGIEAGESIDKLERRIQAVYRQEYEGQARTVARTETMSVFSKARVDAFSEADITQHEWLSARDPLVRETHAGVDGEVRRVGESFSNGLRWPLEWGAPAEEVINCRCITTPVVEGV